VSGSGTTSDNLCTSYGEPAFIKIDVEGHEDAVMSGLSRPPRALSFEFTNEHMTAALACFSKLTALGEYEYNISLAEDVRLLSDRWLNAREAPEYLPTLGPLSWGDVYARHIIQASMSHL
jgi:hypothetical protein